MEYRAVINKNTIIYFSFQSLLDNSRSFTSRELLIPWLLKHNPDRNTGKRDIHGQSVYENDMVKVYEYLEGKIWEQQTHVERIVFKGTGFDFTRPYNHQSLQSNTVEIIGNYHLNPELYVKEKWEIEEPKKWSL